MSPIEIILNSFRVLSMEQPLFHFNILEQYGNHCLSCFPQNRKRSPNTLSMTSPKLGAHFNVQYKFFSFLAKPLILIFNNFFPNKLFLGFLLIIDTSVISSEYSKISIHVQIMRKKLLGLYHVSKS